MYVFMYACMYVMDVVLEGFEDLGCGQMRLLKKGPGFFGIFECTRSTLEGSSATQEQTYAVLGAKALLPTRPDVPDLLLGSSAALQRAFREILV